MYVNVQKVPEHVFNNAGIYLKACVEVNNLITRKYYNMKKTFYRLLIAILYYLYLNFYQMILKGCKFRYAFKMLKQWNIPRQINIDTIVENFFAIIDYCLGCLIVLWILITKLDWLKKANLRSIVNNI